MQADLDNMLAQSKSAEEKAKKAMVDAGRLADELRAEQDHTHAQDKVYKPKLFLSVYNVNFCYETYIQHSSYSLNLQAVKTTEKVLDDLGNRAEDASIAASLGAQQLPVKLEARAREVEHELNRTVQVSKIFPEFHLDLVLQTLLNYKT